MKEAGGGRAIFFPDARNENFGFTSDVGFLINRFVVQGRANVSEAAGSSRVLTFNNKPPQAPPLFTNKKGSSSINLKILQAIMKKGTGNRPEFKPVHQEFVEVTESTANVRYLTHIIKEKWGSEYILVTADGIRIEDSSGTQGKITIMAMTAIASYRKF